jgi:hypothetical protein
MFPFLQRHLWSEIGKLDIRVVNIALDELFRAAIDGGISSRRCEAIGETLVVLSSINVRGKVIAKLRRVSSTYRPGLFVHCSSRLCQKR